MSDNYLAKQYQLFGLLHFALPNIIMMICLSLYIIVDGMFISRILGPTALSAVNMVYPAICLEMTLGIMIATGGSAIIASKMGQGKRAEARKNFSFLVLIEFGLGVVIAILGNFFVTEIVQLLGASEAQMGLSVSYARILFSFAPAFFLQIAFQTFLVTAGKPTLGLIITIFAGIINVVLDYLLLTVFQLGIAGAAIATSLGYCFPAIVGLFYFFNTRKGTLYFVKPTFDWKVLVRACTNGSSEMVTNLANAMTAFLFNYTFLHYYGENGVATITIILYFQYIFTALYFGYASGVAPIISFKYGNKDRKQLSELFKYSLGIIIIGSVVANLLFQLALPSLIGLFTTDKEIYAMTLFGSHFYSFAFVMMGLGIFTSSLFTALGDGKTSAIISFARTFIFIVGAIVTFPLLLGELGVWLAVPFAELLGAVISIVYLYKKQQYGYLKGRIIN